MILLLLLPAIVLEIYIIVDLIRCYARDDEERRRAWMKV